MNEPHTPIRVATRGSQLALWQANWVAAQLRALAPGRIVELVEVKSTGDRDQSTPLAAIGGTGLFTKEIQAAVLDNRADIAVHSMKDLPTQPTPGLCIAAIPPRAAIFDALISPRWQRLESLPSGARVGTSAPRRRALILHARPDVEVVDVRGNVETRLNCAVSGQLDAVILAQAGLDRVNLAHHATEQLAPPRFMPAVGQGALAIECKAGVLELVQLLNRLDDSATRACVEAERALLAELRGGCSVPLGCWARLELGSIRLDATVLDPQGRKRIDVSVGGTDNPQAVGAAAAEELRRLGAEKLLELPN